jgi:hypothetical protein
LVDILFFLTGLLWVSTFVRSAHLRERKEDKKEKESSRAVRGVSIRLERKQQKKKV